MDIDLELTSQQIIDKEFTGIKPGYNPLDVDELGTEAHTKEYWEEQEKKEKERW